MCENRLGFCFASSQTNFGLVVNTSAAWGCRGIMKNCHVPNNKLTNMLDNKTKSFFGCLIGFVVHATGMFVIFVFYSIFISLR